MTKQERIRNFSIIAHIDHGKSTLADRMLEVTGAVSERDMREQVLDDMDLERERGITIKASAVRMEYTAEDGETYELNLIDTPGHVDFSYEVSRALHACEGAVLLVDVSQGVEAQTVANAYMAVDEGLELVPVVSKVDLEQFDSQAVSEEMQETFDFVPEDVVFTSGKTGHGVEGLLEAVVAQVPPPAGDPEAPGQALIFDSEFDPHRGVIIYIRVFDGTIKQGDRIMMMATGKAFEVTEVGVFRPQRQAVEQAVGLGELPRVPQRWERAGEVLVPVQHALGPAGGARRIQHERGVGRRDLNRRQGRRLGAEYLLDAQDAAHSLLLRGDALDGAPGVKSARFAGAKGKDRKLINRQNVAKVLKLLKDVPKEKRTARFVCCLCLASPPDGRRASPDKILIEVEGILKGLIAETPIGENGFGYDPIFFVPKLNKTVAQLTRKGKNAISHRGNAIRKLEPLLDKILRGCEENPA